MRKFGHIFITSLVPAVFVVSVHGDVPSEHGLDALIERIGIENVPTGAGVEVAQVEAANESGDYAPDTNDSAFTGKTFTLRSGLLACKTMLPK